MRKGRGSRAYKAAGKREGRERDRGREEGKGRGKIRISACTTVLHSKLC
jgi:hypothetical protein